jgi:murein L,D-transpeptidase YcbB/YkuD
MSTLRALFRVLAWTACLILLQPAQGLAQDTVAEVLNQRIEELLFGGDLEIRGAPIAAREVLPEVYARRNFAPLWTSDARVDDFLGVLATAPEHGLEIEDYYLEELRALRAAQRASGSALDTADLDILLTESLVRFGYHQVFGKVNPSSLDANINFRREFLLDEGPVEAVPRLIASGKPFKQQLDEAVERGPVYAALQARLAEYRTIQSAGGWPSVPAGETMRVGDEDARVPALRRRLAVTADLPAGADLVSTQFDADLEQAVQAFQTRHALGADGIVGSQSYLALNVPVQTRIDQIRLSLERLRWVQEELGPQFVAVNIAGFRVFFIRDQKFVWVSRTMVGKPYRQTPTFRGDIQYMELNPTWTVPPGILSKDILPAVKRDPGYLAQKNISVIDRDGRKVDPATVNWQAYSRGVPYTLRQEPGPDNALGRIKFIFPNKHFVFLHDTPSRGLFDRAERTFSSGCIRVENPFDLAELLVADQPQWDRAALDRIIESRQTRRIHLKEPLPVLILYLTASVDEDDRIRFYKDVYERDAKLLEALNGDVSIELPEA